MLPYLVGTALMLGSLLAVALRLAPRPAMGAWALISAIACALAALALARQPVGEATLLGRVGSAALRWGFQAGQGQLLWAVLISWLVWLLVGATLIAALHARTDRQHLLTVLAWGVDTAALFYVIGVWLRSRTPTGPGLGQSLLVMAGVILLLPVISAILWRMFPAAKARRLALLIAGGPPLLLGGGYGLFVLFSLTVGRHARWN